MKIRNDTNAADILDSHEKRIGTLELSLQMFLLAGCVKAISRIIGDKLDNSKKRGSGQAFE